MRHDLEKRPEEQGLEVAGRPEERGLGVAGQPEEQGLGVAGLRITFFLAIKPVRKMHRHEERSGYHELFTSSTSLFNLALSSALHPKFGAKKFPFF